jgi:enamine deaminase RidA (YjgF/YER057c/UK114 family)
MHADAVHRRLAELGLILPTPPEPVASYVPVVRMGSLLVVSGQIPFVDGRGALLSIGAVPERASIEQATAAARQCALNAIAIVDRELGGALDRVVRIVRLGVFVASEPGFGEQPRIANGASDLLVEIFGDRGRHARAAVGVSALPLDATVEIEMTVEAV